MELLLPVVLKQCKLQYKMDLTLKNPSAFQHFNGTVTEIIDFYNTKSTLASPMSPWQPSGQEVQPAPPPGFPPGFPPRIFPRISLRISPGSPQDFPQDSHRISPGIPPGSPPGFPPDFS